ncbi:hypothetical protein V5735_16870 (plasmid) [Haladaptatus sp. SPP-AMP-3]|uniref:hypothetical protein n=1 Tax=Haladaptatus sp. SPP-AMP-3 TaxID=3121295 RepID=UPI003C2DFA29
MRRAYGWTRTILTAAAVALALGMSLRVLLTGLFVAFITSELLPVIVFNVCVSVLVGRWFLREVLESIHRSVDRNRVGEAIARGR